MMGFLGQASNALRGRPRGASIEDSKPIEDSEPDDTSVLCVPLSLLSILALLCPSSLRSFLADRLTLALFSFPFPSLTVTFSLSLFFSFLRLLSREMLPTLVCHDADHDEFRDEQEGSIISSIISQLRCVVLTLPSNRFIVSDASICLFMILWLDVPLWLRLYGTHHGDDRIGMDLHRVTFPTFVLEPRSMLERIADFMSHPELVFGSVVILRRPVGNLMLSLLDRAEKVDDPEERFLMVLRYYLSGWHIKPKGVKKPLVLSCFSRVGWGRLMLNVS